MTSQKLSQAISLIKAGNKKAAMPILKEILQSEPNNEKAWIAMYTGVDNPKHKKMCLQKILAINPDNKGARKALADMEGRNQSVAPAPPPPANNYPNHPPAGPVSQAPRKEQRVAPRQKKKASNSKGLIIGVVALFLLFALAAQLLVVVGI